MGTGHRHTLDGVGGAAAVALGTLCGKCPPGQAWPLGMWLGSRSWVCEKGAPSPQATVHGPGAGDHPAFWLSRAPLCVLHLHAYWQRLHRGNRSPDAGRIKGSAHVAAGLKVLCLGE